ncbi:hypothetical protein FNQ90_04295 [Streptomyces alkaliphilus]|uniref:Uncharacterized protein n=1 Tax=Streptomyces alkaliphilus TaxID=1472722 RepID=A0A7W3TAM1_9ACTN|nr:hypothetical protein [Streptomyces alkaliphilus]MBB0243348.1 hypothetical protein [Streptomyces alkaliphilus]
MQDSTLAELHGIALAQRMLLEEVGRDDARDRVALRVLLANAGPRFSEGPRVAGAILEEVDAEGIIGVTGLGQSREDTYRTMDVLDAAGLPMIGTTATATATADGMLERGAQQYFQLAPTNDRQARVAVSFLAHTPLLPASEVETDPDDGATDGADEGTDGDNGVDPDDGVGPGADGDPAADDPTTVPADAAIIVYDELDIYSENLAAAFRTLDARAEEQRRRGDAPSAAAAEVLESGGAALGWDAMDILATAAGLAHRTEGRTGDFDRSAVSTVLNTGNVNIQGATGLLNFRERRVPVEKPVYVVRAGEREAEIVLSCGRFSAGVEDTVWGPQDVPCPREE